MNLTLKRTGRYADGIMSELIDENGTVIAQTLEHAFDGQPKIPNGTFNCVRGTHQLHTSGPFSTFEVTGVAGHSGLLFHWGNYNGDSDGCILVGETATIGPQRQHMVTNSRATFQKFCDLEQGLDSFALTVIG